MAKRVVCAVFDMAVEAFMQPMFAPSAGAVVRSFQDEVRRAESPMHAHPEDYTLYFLCEFDEEKGVFSDAERRILMRGKDAVIVVDQ